MPRTGRAGTSDGACRLGTLLTVAVNERCAKWPYVKAAQRLKAVDSRTVR